MDKADKLARFFSGGGRACFAGGKLKRRRAMITALLFLGGVACFFALQSFAAIPQQINFQGKLTNASNIPLTGTYEVVFTIYDAATGGNNLWSETQTVTTESGFFNVLLGSVTPIPTAEVFTGADRWLGVKVGTDSEMTPRQKLVSVGYAYKAYDSDRLGGQPASYYAAGGNYVLKAGDTMTGALTFESGGARYTMIGTGYTDPKGFTDTKGLLIEDGSGNPMISLERAFVPGPNVTLNGLIMKPGASDLGSLVALVNGDGKDVLMFNNWEGIKLGDDESDTASGLKIRIADGGGGDRFSVDGATGNVVVGSSTTESTSLTVKNTSNTANALAVINLQNDANTHKIFSTSTTQGGLPNSLWIQHSGNTGNLILNSIAGSIYFITGEGGSITQTGKLASSGTLTVGSQTTSHSLSGSGDLIANRIEANGMLYADGGITSAATIESTSGGFKFPDGTTQTTAAGLPSGSSNQTLRHNGSAWVANSFLSNTGGKVGINTSEAWGLFDVRFGGRNSITVDNTTGYVGIGFTPPDQPLYFTLEVNGQMKSDRIKVTKMLAGGTAPAYEQLNSIDVVSGGVAIGGVYGSSVTAPNNGLIVQGSVGVGTTEPSSKLTVSGTIETIGAGGIKFPDGTTQTTAFTGTLTDYVLKAGDTMTGTLTIEAQYYSKKVTADTSIDWNDGNVQEITLGATNNITFSNPQAGAVYTLFVRQDGTGGRTINWPTSGVVVKWPGGVEPTLSSSANALDIFTFVSDGTNLYNLGFAADLR